MNKLFLVLILVASAPAWCQLSKTEKKMANWVESNRSAETRLLETAVNMNSGSMNFEGVKLVGDLFKQEFEALGFDARWVNGTGFERAGHLIARHEGAGKGPKLLLIGHLDTVFEPDSPNQTFRMENDSIVRGPGVVDMKGGDVMIIYALKALQASGQLKDMTVEVVFTGDEEKSGRPLNLARKDLIEAAKRADIAIGFENGDSNPATAVVSRRGSTGWELLVEGVAAHSSQVFSDRVGAGAIYETSRVLTEFYHQLADEEYLTFNPGVILGGTAVDYSGSTDGGSASGKSNVVAQKTVVKGDLRAVSLEQLARAQETMRRIAEESLPKTKSTIKFSEGGYPPLSPSAGNEELLRIYSSVSQDLGYGPVSAVAPINAGAADISFTSGYVRMAIDGLGLSGGKDHTIDEFGNLNMLVPLTQRAAIFLYRLSKGD
jgi:glutamate carboxypeptidase